MTEYPEWLHHRLVWKQNAKDPADFPELVSVKPSEDPCDGCGKNITKPRTVNCRRYVNPTQHWRNQCSVCRNFYNPHTGKFDICPRNIHLLYQKNSKS